MFREYPGKFRGNDQGNAEGMSREVQRECPRKYPGNALGNVEGISREISREMPPETLEQQLPNAPRSGHSSAGTEEVNRPFHHLTGSSHSSQLPLLLEIPPIPAPGVPCQAEAPLDPFWDRLLPSPEQDQA